MRRTPSSPEHLGEWPGKSQIPAYRSNLSVDASALQAPTIYDGLLHYVTTEMEHRSDGPCRGSTKKEAVKAFSSTQMPVLETSQSRPGKLATILTLLTAAV